MATTTTAASAGGRWRRYARRAAFLAAAALVVLFVAFFLLPVWISNEQGRRYVLDRLNARLHGPTVAIDTWSLGWFRKTQLTNLRILQPDGTTLLTCPHVSSGLTLWDIFWGRYDIGNTTADDLEINIVRHSDGTTSLDSLAAGAADMLRSARGALQITNGRLTMASQRTGQVAQYLDVKIAINVASPDAPFHVQFSALGSVAATTQPATAQSTLSLRGTFPPSRSLSAQNLAHPDFLGMLTDVEFSATHVPTGLICDFLGADDRWADSFGNVLELVQFSGHALPAQDDIRLTLLIRGAAAAAGDSPWIDTRMLLHAPDDDGHGATLSIPSPAADYHANAALHYSAPLGRLLGRLNPLLEEAAPTPAGGGGGLVKGTVSSLSLPLDNLPDSQAAARLTFPPLQFTARNGPSLRRQLEVLTAEPRPAAAPIEGFAEVLLVQLRDGRFGYDNFRVTLGKSRLTFSGNVSLDGRVNLLATVPEDRSGLAAGSARVAIRGTVDAPLMQRAE